MDEVVLKNEMEKEMNPKKKKKILFFPQYFCFQQKAFHILLAKITYFGFVGN